MNIKTYAKINIWITKIVFAFIMRIVMLCSIIMCPIVIFINPPAKTFWFLTSCIFYFGMTGAVLDLINKQFNIIQKFLTVSNYHKFILSIVLIRTRSAHNSTQLNSELDKLSKAIENKSSFYGDLNQTDFPLLNKLFRRLEQAQAKQKKSDKIKHDPTKDNQQLVENIQEDLTKLDLSSSPKLLTMDNMDDELNNLIAKNIGQSINSKTEKCKINQM